MVLAAGRGVRMRDAFGGLHKSLLPVGGAPLIVRLIGRLSAAGFSPIVVNVCHQADAIVAACGDGSGFGNRIEYSREDSALETAGGIANALPLLGTGTFLAANSDVYSEIDLVALRRDGTRAMATRGSLAHLALVPNPEHNPAGDFDLKDGLVGRPGEGRDLTYSGVGLFDAAAFADIEPPAKVPLIDVLEPLARRGKVSGERVAAAWSDVGTPERYEELRRRLGEAGTPAASGAEEEETS